MPALPTGAGPGSPGRSLIIRLSALRSTQWQSRDQTLLFFELVAGLVTVEVLPRPGAVARIFVPSLSRLA